MARHRAPIPRVTYRLGWTKLDTMFVACAISMALLLLLPWI